MNIADILAAERVQLQSGIHSRKRALEALATVLTDSFPYLTCSDVFNALLMRERLGSTSMSEGVALPHARIDWIDHCIGGFICFQGGVDFNAMDGQRVDLVFGLLIPTDTADQHMDLLRQLADTLSLQETRKRLRSARDDQQLYRYLVNQDS